MQTFLPYPDFDACARVLDDRRLGKQRVETFQILRALTWPTYGWKNHPAVAMWRGFVPALVLYGVTVCAHWRQRGYTDVTASALLSFTDGQLPRWDDLLRGGQLPPWLGDRAVHASHRTALLRKAPEHYASHFGIAVDAPRAGEDSSGDSGGEPADDTAGYVWPDPVYPRWPMTVDPPGPLRLDEVARMLGRDVPERLTGLVEGLRDRTASRADLPVAGRREAYRVAIASALLTGRPVLFAHPGQDLPAADPGGTLVLDMDGVVLEEDSVRRRLGGAAVPATAPVTRSIARPATDADTAAVRAAARQRPHVVFARPQQLRGAPHRSRLGADLAFVVVDPAWPDAAVDLLPAGLPTLRLRAAADTQPVVDVARAERSSVR